jgi:DVNP family
MATRKMKRIGSKAEVYHGSAHHTSGGLTKKDLLKNKHGRIVSRKQQAAGKKAIKRLFSMGYKPKKGTFKAFRKGMRTTRRRGGNQGATEPGATTYGAGVSTAKLQELAKTLTQ